MFTNVKLIFRQKMHSSSLQPSLSPIISEAKTTHHEVANKAEDYSQRLRQSGVSSTFFGRNNHRRFNRGNNSNRDGNQNRNGNADDRNASKNDVKKSDKQTEKRQNRNGAS